MTLSFMQSARVHANARTLVEALGGTADDASLREAYFAHLIGVQGHPFAHALVDGRPPLSADLDDTHTRALAERLTEGLVADAVATELDDVELETARQAIRDAWGLIEVLDPDLAASARFLVGTFLLVRHPGGLGGSFGDTVGVVWLNPPAAWTIVDYAETIVHEATHQGFTLEEMVHGLYTVGIDERAAHQATSAVLRRRRPHDLAFHSAVVAEQLRRFHEGLANHQRAQDVASGLDVSLAELDAESGILTEHGRRLLHELQAVPALHG
jgi:hypothetical protein